MGQDSEFLVLLGFEVFFLGVQQQGAAFSWHIAWARGAPAWAMKTAAANKKVNPSFFMCISIPLMSNDVHEGYRESEYSHLKIDALITEFKILN